MTDQYWPSSVARDVLPTLFDHPWKKAQAQPVREQMVHKSKIGRGSNVVIGREVEGKQSEASNKIISVAS